MSKLSKPMFISKPISLCEAMVAIPQDHPASA